MILRGGGGLKEGGRGGRGRGGVVAWLVAAACLVGQVAGVVHAACVEHRVCPEHGGLEHVVLPAPGTATAAGVEAWQAWRSATPWASAADDHDQCLAETEAPAPAQTPSLAAQALPSPSDAVPAPRETPVVARALVLGRAPKTSPPPRWT